jgi:hypothetical protein
VVGWKLGETLSGGRIGRGGVEKRFDATILAADLHTYSPAGFWWGVGMLSKLIEFSTIVATASLIVECAGIAPAASVSIVDD